MWDSAISTRFPHFSMSAIQQLCGFAAALEHLLSARDAAALDAMWEELNLGQVGWEALALARRANTEALEPALAEVDRRLLAVLERCRALLDPHIVTFRVPELERWQHAAAQRRSCVGDDRAQSGNSPTRADERGGGRMLPALQLRHAECDDVRIEQRAATFQYGQESAINFGECGLERFGVGAPRERQCFPSDLTEIQLLPHLIQRGGVAR